MICSSFALSNNAILLMDHLFSFAEKRHPSTWQKPSLLKSGPAEVDMTNISTKAFKLGVSLNSRHRSLRMPMLNYESFFEDDDEDFDDSDDVGYSHDGKWDAQNFDKLHGDTGLVYQLFGKLFQCFISLGYVVH